MAKICFFVIIKTYRRSVWRNAIVIKMARLKTNLNQPTKQHIVDMALRLFYKNGYNNTSIERIVKAAGVSKGAFYHYFNSKDDILESVAAETVAQGISVFKKIAEDDKLDALAKLNKIMGWAGNSFYLKELDWWRGLMLGSIIVQTDSPDLFDKYKKHSLDKLGPHLLKIFKQGVAEKTFNILYPEETCEFFIEFMSNFRRKLFFTIKECTRQPAQVKVVFKKLKFLEDTINKILGVSPGSVRFGPFTLNKFNKFFTKYKLQKLKKYD